MRTLHTTICYKLNPMTMHLKPEGMLADHHAEIADKIEASYAAAQRGELISPEQVRSSLEKRKRAWLANVRDDSASPL